jgi:hypothetical protein
MAADKHFHGPAYDHDKSPDYNFKKDFGQGLHDKPSVDRQLQWQKEEKSKKLAISEDNWQKIVQCWEDFIDQDYDDRADALFSLIAELIMHGNDPPTE